MAGKKSSSLNRSNARALRLRFGRSSLEMVHRTISFAFGKSLLTIANNGLRLNDAAVSDPRLTVDAAALNDDGVLRLSSGKKKHVLVKPA